MKILLAEDEQAIADTLIYALSRDGFSVRHVLFGHEVLPVHESSPFDLIILDVGLPDTTGFEVIKKLRASSDEVQVPVMFLTARAEEVDRVVGLELGADDYVLKPFSPREVVARVRAILRRGENFRPVNGNSNQVWRHDPDALRIAYRGQHLDMTRYEYLLLALLIKTPGRVFTREYIMNCVWADSPDTTDRSIDTHIKTLRAKLRRIDPDREVIQTHRGTGYSIAP